MAFFCENCGTKLPADAAFCENCGAAVARDEQIENTEPAVTCTNKVDVNLFADKGWAKSWERLLLEELGKASSRKGRMRGRNNPYQHLGMS